MKLRRDLLQLDLDEKVIFFLRRHWFIFFKKILNSLLLGSLPFLTYFVLKIYFPHLLADKIVYPLLVLVASLYLLFTWISLFHAWIDYYFDLWVVTNKQIIDVEQAGLFSRTLSKQPLIRVQDIMAESKGFFPTLFRFGNVYIQTAGAKERFIFRDIKNPYEVSQKINKLVRESLGSSEK
ncbi:MAG: PH domain-containing protein [Patescibacteria group bacterium]|nr:PH domain-containing protein [Patescibacteria group bacterium]